MRKWKLCTNLMTRRKSWGVAIASLLVWATACDAPAPPRHHHHFASSRPAAARSVWNPAPGDPSVALRTPAEMSQVSMAPASLPALEEGAARTLVLYDVGGPWGALGELYAVGAANLASHFGGWTAKPAVTYSCGELASYDAAIYMGSTYDEALPACLLDDVLGGSRPVIWAGFNLWQLTGHAGYNQFIDQYGFMWTGLDFSRVDEVDYKGVCLARYGDNPGGILGTTIYDAAKAEVLATARRDDGTGFPWALRSGNLTYIGELPFTYMTEEDRVLAFADLLFDALDPNAVERHRALVRIEDVTPDDDPDDLRAVADYLSSRGVPFGVAVVSEYHDPLGFYTGGTPEHRTLRQAPEVVSALKYMESKGGVLLMHGYTHQWDGDINPYTEVSADDTEFFRFIENDDHTINYAGPLPDDSVSWATGRMDKGFRGFQRAGLTAPTIFEFPHYAGSVASYQAAAAEFPTRWERSLYFPGALSGSPPDYRWIFGQLFPYPVRDVYGTKVLPENLGDIEPEPFYIFPVRFPEDLLNAASKNMVVRDGVAAFYFHPFFDIDYLKETVEGMQAMGFTFVSPNSL